MYAIATVGLAAGLVGAGGVRSQAANTQATGPVNVTLDDQPGGGQMGEGDTLTGAPGMRNLVPHGP